jgi:FkbM family methyltransferase
VHRIQQTYNFIRQHPLGRRHTLRAVRNWIGWQLRSRLTPGPHIVPFVGATRLAVKRGMHGATGNIYCGLHEFEDMAFVMHLLREDDLFVDVGANVGAYTVLSSGVCRAKSLAIEPAKSAQEALKVNIQLNSLDQEVEIQDCAVGARFGTVSLSQGLDCVNHVLGESENIPYAEVPLRTLDDLLGGAVPTLMKIDVEGYELSVLQGAAKVLAEPGLLAIIVEANGSGRRYGLADSDVTRLLQGNDFSVARYDPLARDVTAKEIVQNTTGNTLFVRDLDQVRIRVRGAPLRSVLGHQL